MGDISITAKDGGTFTGYLAKPTGNTGPGIVVIQEIFGVNKFLRDLCDDLAASGYIALCPDLFWRQEPGIQLTDKTEAEWARAFQLFNGFDENKGVEDLIATLNHLRALEGCTGKVGTIGFCLGGKLSFLMAARSDADCNVSYYGVGLTEKLSEAGNIKKPLLMHIAEEDKFVSKDQQAEIKAGLKHVPNIEIHSYPGVNHAFARVNGEHYDRAAAELANTRTGHFLAQHLKGKASEAAA